MLEGGTLLPALPWQRALWVGAGSCLAILLLQAMGQGLHTPLLLAPFGASCVLLFVAPQSEFSRPRNVLLGYGIATLVGFVALWLFGEQWWTVAVAVGVTIGFMCLTHTVHPPAGAHPIVIVMGAAAPARPCCPPWRWASACCWPGPGASTASSAGSATGRPSPKNSWAGARWPLEWSLESAAARPRPASISRGLHEHIT